MSTRGLWGKLAGIAIGLVVAAPGVALAAKPAAKTGKPAATTSPSSLKQDTFKLTPPGLKFGMTRKEVVRLYNRAIEKDYKKQMQEVQPGVEMTRLREEIDRKKDEFRLSWFTFDGKPASLDDSPYRFEYGHENEEGYLKISYKGKSRMLFFMKNKLWKVIDIYKLGESSKWGIDFAQASDKIGKRLGAAGRKQGTAEKVRFVDEVDWADSNIHLRAMNVGGKKLALAYVDLGTEGNLATLRPERKKNKEAEDVDPAVRAVMRDTSKDPRVNPDINPETGKAGKGGKAPPTPPKK